jgi:hypothetical protein
VEVGPDEHGPAEVGTVEVSPDEAGPAKVGTAEVYLMEVGLGEDEHEKATDIVEVILGVMDLARVDPMVAPALAPSVPVRNAPQEDLELLSISHALLLPAQPSRV